MIISIRGPSGSGKTTLVRKLLQHHTCVPIFVEPRRNPMYYNFEGNIVLLGHYEIVNGGIDTLKSLRQCYELAMDKCKEGKHVVMEGKCLSDGFRTAYRTHMRGFDIRVLSLSTPVETCVASVRSRGHNIKEENIQKIYDKTERNFLEFIRHGIQAYRGDRAQCLRKAEQWLGI